MEARRYLEWVIAQKFTRVDGSTRLYVARENVFPGLSAWPIPHDAPYKPNIDRSIMAIREGGLYEKWSIDVIGEARRVSRAKQQGSQGQGQGQGQGEIAAGTEADVGVKALTIQHLQGPLLLLVLTLGFSFIAFLTEVVIGKYCSCTSPIPQKH
ncbi:hypothetical protein Pmani_013355 [Petrolisthes manimaculis]|uniref:Uncharacterized protein n=1 Tax=Petrolisthes manimaculis TaxID=1843537 RepID=A0AAE1U9F5_9EUCA|nr:hypothetical protein Pmani_013355 [Petrolisthes manimaculis]